MKSMPPVPTPEPAAEPAVVSPADPQETDVWWGAYAGRTMLPSFVLCGLVTAGVALVWLYWVEYQASELEARYTGYAILGPLWLFQLGRWLYRILTRTYRLTTRRLYLERTFFHVPTRIVELGEITKVVVKSSALERRLKVGRLQLQTKSLQLPDVVLEGVYDPERVAQRIRDLARQNQGRM